MSRRSKDWASFVVIHSFAKSTYGCRQSPAVHSIGKGLEAKRAENRVNRVGKEKYLCLVPRDKSKLL